MIACLRIFVKELFFSQTCIVYCLPTENNTYCSVYEIKFMYLLNLLRILANKNCFQLALKF